jgi:hypothetical protein
MVGPTVRVVGDHEAHHVAILQAAASRLSVAISDGDYSLSQR